MKSNISPAYMRLFFWYFNKNFRLKISGLFVDTKSVQMVKNLIS